MKRSAIALVCAALLTAISFSTVRAQDNPLAPTFKVTGADIVQTPDPLVVVYAQGYHVAEGKAVELTAKSTTPRADVRGALIVLFRQGSFFPQTQVVDLPGGLRPFQDEPLGEIAPRSAGNYRATVYFRDAAGVTVAQAQTIFFYGFANGDEREEGPQITDARSHFLGFGNSSAWQVTLKGSNFGYRTAVVVHHGTFGVGPLMVYPVITDGMPRSAEVTFFLPITVNGSSDIISRPNVTVVNLDTGTSATCAQCLKLRTRFE